MNDPIRLAVGLHLHQPVGNFDSVFQEHLDHVYRPLLTHLRDAELLPVTLHLSGPLLAWLDTNGPDLLDDVGRLVADGEIELLLSGHDEPILVAIPREDRLDQIARMRETLRTLFGAEATGLWLTERVWEPDLAGDLAAAGVEYVLVDDRHFLVAGFERRDLDLPYRTEADGRILGVFAIDERLRYLVPFRPPEEFAAYLADLRREGRRLAVLADDGEKFGGWPGTREWVYERGWLAKFTAMVARLQTEGALRLVTLREAYQTLPSGGLAYLPSASYREMEGWSLPPAQARRLAALEQELGEERTRGPEGALIRGSHWRNFLVRYPEANRMHKKMLALSRLARERGNPEIVRAAIGRAQCNDAYWHGVFGGLYLPHLRDAVWRNLADAEAGIRVEEGLGWEWNDLDADGVEEIWVHSAACSIVVSPARGGAIEDLTLFRTGRNHASVLARRQEAYHAADGQAGGRTDGRPDEPGPGAASIHELARQQPEGGLPPVDREPRSILQERLLPADATEEAVAGGFCPAARSWATEPFEARVLAGQDQVTIVLTSSGLEKRLRVAPDGTIEASYRWDASGRKEGEWFTVEMSLSHPLDFQAPGAETWSYLVETVAQSERGFDRTIQGTATVVRWPVSATEARLVIRAAAPDPPN